MITGKMIRIVIRLKRLRIYRKLEGFVAFFEEGVLVTLLSGRIRKCIAVLMRRISRIIRKMRHIGVSDGERMYFYRLVRKFLPAFVKGRRMEA